MRRFASGLVIIVIGCTNLAPYCLALDTDFGMSSLDSWDEKPQPAFRFENDKWDAGISAGYSFMLGDPKITQATGADNLGALPVTLVSLSPLTLAEQPEWRFTGDLQDSFAISGHVYYRVSSLVSLGLESGFERHDIELPYGPSSGGDPNYPLYPPSSVSWHVDIIQVVPAVKIAPRAGRFRPFLSVGAGIASINESLLIDRGFIASETVGGITTPVDEYNSANRHDIYFAVNGALGVEFGLPYDFSLGLNTRYAQIFAPNPEGGYKIITPNAQLDYHF